MTTRSEGWQSELAPELRRAVRRTPHPTWVVPMAAVLTERRFDEPNWIVERKLDGIRCMAYLKGPKLHLLSRNALPQNYPHIESELLEQPADDFICDGEVVGFHGRKSGFKYLRA